MASSGTLTIALRSVDYISGHSWACYSEGNKDYFHRGSAWLDTTANWTLGDDQYLTLSYGSSVGTLSWYVCSVRYTLSVQWSPDGVNWQTLATSEDTDHYDCSNPATRILTTSLVSLLISRLGRVYIPASGYIRVYTAANAACPDETFPNAYPNEAASQATAVEIYIDVNWTARINFNDNGGSGGPGSASTTGVPDPLYVTIPNSSPTRTNYRFEGWSWDSGALDATYHAGDSIAISKSNPTRTLYAVWRKYYRPGKIKTASSWEIIDRNAGGNGQRTSGGSWKELRTIDAPTGTNDPPKIYRNNNWYNQRGGTYPASRMA